MALDYGLVKKYFACMVLKTTCGGREYTWIEKSGRACLTVDGSTLLWWGEPGDPQNVIVDVPLEVLLSLSIQRNRA